MTSARHPSSSTPPSRAARTLVVFGLAAVCGLAGGNAWAANFTNVLWSTADGQPVVTTTIETPGALSTDLLDNLKLRATINGVAQDLVATPPTGTSATAASKAKPVVANWSAVGIRITPVDPNARTVCSSLDLQLTGKLDPYKDVSVLTSASAMMSSLDRTSGTGNDDLFAFVGNPARPPEKPDEDLLSRDRPGFIVCASRNAGGVVDQCFQGSTLCQALPMVVRAYHDYGKTQFQWNVSLVQVPGQPAQPFFLNAFPVDTRIFLSWFDLTNNEQGFLVERCQFISGVVDCGSDNQFAQIASLPANTNTYTDDGVVAPNQYVYRVRTFSDFGGCSIYSNRATAQAQSGGTTSP